VIYLILLSVDVFIMMWIAYKSNNKIAMICVGAIGLTLPLFLTFTVVAYMCIGAGMALAIYLSYEGKKKIVGYLIAAMLIVTGYMIRGNTAASAIILFAPVLILLVIESKASVKNIAMLLAGACLLGIVLYICTSNPHKYRSAMMWAVLLATAIAGLIIGMRSKLYRELILTVAVVCMAVIAVNFAENIMLDEGWKAFREYTSARSGVLDYPHARYDAVGEQLKRAGITESGYNLLFDWSFLDKQVFSADTLKELRSIFAANNSGIGLKKLITDYKDITCIILPIIAAIVFGLVSNKKRRSLIGLTLVILELIYIALVLRGRFVLRVSVPLCMIAITGMYLISDAKWRGRNHYVPAVIAAVICTMVVGMQYASAIRNPERASESGKAVKSYVLEHSDEHFIIVSKIYNDMYFAQQPAFYIKQERMFDNTVKSGSGDSFSPRYYDQMREWKVSDPDRLFMQLLEDDTLRYVDHNSEDMRTYLEEQSGKTVTVEIEKSFGDGLCVYKFSAD